MNLCTRDLTHYGFGRPCEECGHTSTLHPGIHNPAVEHCLICAVIALIDEARLSVASTVEHVRLVNPPRVEPPRGRLRPEEELTEGHRALPTDHPDWNRAQDDPEA